MLKIGVNTFYTESYKPLADIVIPNLQLYCDRHGYDLIVEKIHDGNFHFIKTKTARHLLDNYDLVWTVECDILVTNHKLKIENFIDSSHHFFICKDVNNFNGGSFITKNSGWSKAWLDFIEFKKSEYGDEQNVIEDFGDSILFRPCIKVLAHPSINSIPL